MRANDLSYIHSQKRRSLSIIYLYPERAKGEALRTHSMWSSRTCCTLTLSFETVCLVSDNVPPAARNYSRRLIVCPFGSSSRFRNAGTGEHVRDLSETLNSGERFPRIQMEMPSLCIISFRCSFFFTFVVFFLVFLYPRFFFVSRKLYVEPVFVIRATFK